jgi:hypothetical protein
MRNFVVGDNIDLVLSLSKDECAPPPHFVSHSYTPFQSGGGGSSRKPAMRAR